MADEMVLQTQKWLNKTYGNVAGFGNVPENGKTGWPTIYGLIKGLQVELGITSLSENFGPGTQAQFKKIEHTLVKDGNYKKNIAQIIQGGFWCKGYNVGWLNGVINDVTLKCVRGLARDAGLIITATPEEHNGQMTVQLMKALLDMSAFVLVPGGDAKVRQIQQALNRSYNAYFGLLSCDGIYQRDSNKALIFALQAEMGMGVGEANGYFGEGTTARCPILSATQGKVAFKKILQYALYVNGFNQSGIFDGVYSSVMENEVVQYRQFMKLSPEDWSTADVRVIKGLLVSHGDQTRVTSAADMATQLNLQSHFDRLKSNGYTTVGRYLTGTVGVFPMEKAKNLTIQEMNLIKANGMTVFPIYQDGGWYLNYFSTPGQGNMDARKAAAAARKLGFKKGTVIYFACDFDALGHEIEGVVLPYFSDVFNEMSVYAPEYQIGAYGPRNLLTRLSEEGLITSSFVSNMSSGFSGNLGYKMPSNWAFDQYIETSLEGIPIDKVAMSGRHDNGQKTFNPTIPVDANGLTSEQIDANLYAKVVELQKKSPILDSLPTLNFTRDKEFSYGSPTGMFEVKMIVSLNHKIATNSSYEFKMKNGKVDTAKFANDMKLLNTAEDFKNNLGDTLGMISTFGQFTNEDGSMSLGLVKDSHAFGAFGLELVLNSTLQMKNDSGVTITQNFSVKIQIFYRNINNGLPSLAKVNEGFEKSPAETFKLAVGGLAVVGIAVLAVPLLPEFAIASAFSAFVAWFLTVMPA